MIAGSTIEEHRYTAKGRQVQKKDQDLATNDAMKHAHEGLRMDGQAPALRSISGMLALD